MTAPAQDRPLSSPVAAATPDASPALRTNQIHTGCGRQLIFRKLDLITLDEVSYRSASLDEVIADLSSKARQRDPEGRGVNFILSPNVDAQGTAGTAPAERVDWSAVHVTVFPPLRDLRLRDVLDMMALVADRPLRYSVEDYAVVLSVGGPEARLLSRTFKVDPNTFQQGLEGVVGVPFPNIPSGTAAGGAQGGAQGGGGVLTVPRVSIAPGTGIGGAGGVTTPGPGANPSGGIPSVSVPTPQASSSQMARQYFSSLGLDLTPPKSVFFNDRAGILAVHASAQDLDLIEKAVGGLSTRPAPPPEAAHDRRPANSAAQN